MLTLQVMDLETFEKVGEIAQFVSLSMTRSYYGTGVIEITIDPRTVNALTLLPDRVVFPSGQPERAYIIEDIVSLTRTAYSVKGTMLKGITRRRYCVPPLSLPVRLWQYNGVAWAEITTANAIRAALIAGTVYQGLTKPATPTSGMLWLDLADLGTGYDWGTALGTGAVISDLGVALLRSKYQNFGWDLFTGDAESALHHYIANNLISPEDAGRAWPDLIAGTNLGRGAELPWQARFDRLDTMLQTIGEATGVGYDMALDLTAKKIVANVWVGADRTSGSNACLISEKTGNAASVKLARITSGSANVCYVGGAGEDENRFILSVGTESGIARRELWVEAGSIDDAALLTLYGQNKLAAAAEKATLTAELIDSGACRYGRNYDVGDLVVVRDVYGNTQNARVNELKEVHEGGKRTLSATFGDAPVNMATLLARGGAAAR